MAHYANGEPGECPQSGRLVTRSAMWPRSVRTTAQQRPKGRIRPRQCRLPATTRSPATPHKSGDRTKNSCHCANPKRIKPVKRARKSSADHHGHQSRHERTEIGYGWISARAFGSARPQTTRKAGRPDDKTKCHRVERQPACLRVKPNITSGKPKFPRTIALQCAMRLGSTPPRSPAAAIARRWESKAVPKQPQISAEHDNHQAHAFVAGTLRCNTHRKIVGADRLGRGIANKPIGKDRLQQDADNTQCRSTERFP